MTARNPALEQRIREAPDDVAGYSVYADWLIEQGDPRGEVIAKAIVDPPKRKPPIPPELAAFEDALAFEYRNGFFRLVAVVAKDAARVYETLAAVLAHPMAIALEELLLRAPKLDANATARVLRRGPCPPLSRIDAGIALPDLGDVYPQITRDPETLWYDALRRASALLAKQRPTWVSSVATQLPLDLFTLVSHSGEVLETRDAEVIGGLGFELGGHPIGIVEAMRAFVALESRDRLAHAIAALWFSDNEALGDRNKLRWMFDVAAAIGGPRCAALFGERLNTITHARCVQALGHLREMNTPASLAELAGFAYAAPESTARREAANEALGRRQERWVRLLRACPLAPLPETSERIAALQPRWFVDLMVESTPLELDAFAEWIAHHPIRGPIAKQLLWGHKGRGGGRLFRIGEVDRRTLGPGLVRLVHPLDLTPEQLAEWRTRFAELAIEQPILQLERPTFTEPITIPPASELSRVVMAAAGWDLYTGMYDSPRWSRYFERAGAKLTFEDTALTAYRRGPFALEEVDPIVLSECRYVIAQSLT